MNLHPLDKKGNYTEEELEKFMVFCYLDRAMSYDKVCYVFNMLDKNHLTTKKGLQKIEDDELSHTLKVYGHRFPNQTADFLKLFSINTFNLKTITREELVKFFKGIGYKLASMYLRNTRGENYAVIDIHIKRWLEEQGCKGKNYIELEKEFLKKCEELKTTAYDLDMEIWQERRKK